MGSGMKKALQTLKKPSVFIPIVLSVALIVALLSFSDLKKVLALMADFQRLYLLYYLLLMIGYEAVRGVQWHYSLNRLELRIPLTTQIFAFALSEVTKVLPIGNYFQNYVLQQSKGADFGETSAATTLIILEEIVVSLAGVVILGLGAWTGWVRTVVLVGSAIAIAVIWLLVRLHPEGHRPDWVQRRRGFRKVADEFGRFREGAVNLMHPRAIAVTLALSATYLIIGGAALYVVVLGLGVTNATFGETLAVYFFSLAVALMLPIPVDIGVIEVSGLGAFIAVGVDRSAALGAVFANRILSILASIAIAAIIVLILHKEVRGLFSYVSTKRGQASEHVSGGAQRQRESRESRESTDTHPAEKGDASDESQRALDRRAASG